MLKKDSICLRCGFEWRKNVEDPLRCPKCTSYKWNVHPSLPRRSNNKSSVNKPTTETSSNKSNNKVEWEE